MSWRNRDVDGDEEADDGGGGEREEEEEQKQGDERIVFLIDSRRKMFEQKNDGGDCHLRDCLLVVLAVMKAKIVSLEKCYLGVTFFGCQEQDADTSSAVLQYIPLEIPSAARIRQLQELVDNFDTLFPTQIGCGDVEVDQTYYCPLREALWSCSASFASKSTVVKAHDFKRVWLFTNDDQPNSQRDSAIADQQFLLQVGRDCADTNIEISLWHLSCKGCAPFDHTKFFAKLLVAEQDEALEDRITDGGTMGFSDARALVSIRKKFVKKRPLIKCLMSIGAGVDGGGTEMAFGVQLFKFVRPTKRPLSIVLHAGTNEPVKTVTFTIDALDGTELADTDLVDCVEVGGRKIQYSKSEKNSALQSVQFDNISGSDDRSSGGGSLIGGSATGPTGATEVDPYDLFAMLSSSSGAGFGASVSDGGGGRVNKEVTRLRIHCFTPLVMLPPEFSVEPSLFVSPFEGEVTGSGAPFAALLKQLASKELMAVGTYAKNSTSQLRLCVLLPQEEVLESNRHTQLVPPGFNLVLLPFRSELRYHSGQISQGMYTASLEPNISEAADTLVKQLALFKEEEAHKHVQPIYSTLENPASQLFFSVLQAIALSETEATSWTKSQDQMTRAHLLSSVAVAASSAESSTSKTSGQESDAVLSVAVASATQKLRVAGEEFAESINLPEDAVALMNDKKRKAASSGSGGGAPKRVKKDVEPVDEVQVAEWKIKFGPDGDGIKLSNDALKDICKSLGLPVSGKKEVLVGKIVEKLKSL